MKQYSEYTKQYVQDICNALTNEGILIRHTTVSFSPEKFETLTKLIQDHIIMSPTLFNLLDNKGLVNRGKCPYTGQRIDVSFPSWSMSDRKIYLSHDGYSIMQKEDDEEYARVMGTPPPKRHTSAGKPSGCYIATACYGNEYADEVLILKAYRDNVLSKKQIGRLFIRLYYFLSPPIAKRLKNKDKVNRFIRDKFLNKLIKKIK